jgi:hypothetical protein
MAELPKDETMVRSAFYLKLKGGNLNDEGGINRHHSERSQNLESIS